MYYVVHYVSDPHREPIQNVIDALFKKFDIFDVSGVKVHITFKYAFEETYLSTIENICNEVTEKYPSGNYTIGDIGCFDNNVVFLQVKLDETSNTLYQELLRQFKEKEVPLSKHEENGISFHITLAEQTAKDYEKIMEYVKGMQFHATKKLDNLIILRFDGEVFTIYKTYLLNCKN